MKFLILSLFIGLTIITDAQNMGLNPLDQTWEVNATFNHDFFIGGYVRVRELQSDGDKLSLGNDLGMKDWNSASLEIVRFFRNHSGVRASFEYFIFNGSSIINRDIWFNATHLKGSDGLSIYQTQQFRGQLCYERPFHLVPNLRTICIVGLLYDGLIFRIRGTTLPDTQRNESYEDFISQALPYPQLGLRIEKELTAKSSLTVEIKGTWIPLFKSFFIEGGHMFLHYYAMNINISYRYHIKTFYFQPGIHYRLLKTYENSGEDTNDFFISSGGVNLTAGISF